MEKHKTGTRSKKNIYFLHIPKCGGVSLKSAISNSLTDEDVFGFGHRPYNQIQDPEEKFIFTFVRNPWDRIVSLYSFWKNQDESHRHYKFDKEQVDFIQNNNIKFDDFVKQIRDRHPIFMKKRHPHPYLGYFFPKPQCISFIGKVEAYQQDFDNLCKLIGIERQTLPLLNKSKRTRYTDYYDKELRNIVADLYSKDIDYFGYKFGD